MTYFCKSCDYQTNDASNWKRHLVSDKHNCLQSNVIMCKETAPQKIIKYKQTYKCTYCDACFTNRSNLHRHEKLRCTCKLEFEKKLAEKEIHHKQEIQDIIKTYENRELVRQLGEMKTQIEQLKQDKEHFKETQKLSSTTLDKSVSALTYLTTHYKKAPELKQLTQEAAKELLLYEKRLYDYLVYHTEEGSLDQYLGDIILKYVKKDNPDDQSVWNSDVSRLTYLVRGLVEDEQTWQRDAKGVKFTKFVLTPIIDYLKNYLYDLLTPKEVKPKSTNGSDDSNSVSEQDDDDTVDINSDAGMQRTKSVLDIIQTMKSKKFKNDTLLHIASHVPLIQIKQKKKPKK